ncbi:IclR family transcriptional regulator C-terminal domain-containing protein [Chelatococcus sp. SYSU_G07232]|uniref:IclR family transcriptional regulator C-terminal domain-containing protein n=1 Tax=Chelatococcus albus TaxID=3047466 RepID=A0ABT7ADQ5_9HYPH|nr:IclR family transcriptional regulator C-terminal domain-containing protein [Chelatococcus sp. SYSU_G07232]MDJ1157512.1 IclR family transcriptional regulator C-terminal domain-containing protein [Chelatococcus sp. SYSU_G07232]
MTKTDGDRDFMGGLGKGLAVIECFDGDHERLSISEVAAQTGLSRAAARRCLITLQKLGYAAFDGKFFTLTPRVLRLGYAYLSSTALPQLIQPFLERLSEELHESCSASILDGTDIVYIARSATRRIMSVGLSVGTRLPAYCTSMGRVLLAALPAEEAEARLKASDRRRLTARTRTGLEELMEEIGRVREQGFCINDQELELGLVSIAVPVVNGAGVTVAALNVSAQSARLSAADLEARFLPKLRQTQETLRPLIER